MNSGLLVVGGKTRLSLRFGERAKVYLQRRVMISRN
jgi:hypothetical protein